MCAYVYLHTLNIGVLWIYKGWNRYRVEMQIWRPPHSQNDRRHEKMQRLWGNLWTRYIQKTPTVYSAYSLFFKERKWQKNNSSDLAKFQDLLERRQLVGDEKSVEITGLLFSKWSYFVFLVMWQEKSFPYPCVKYLAQPFPPSAQSHWWQNASQRSASSASSCPHWFPPGAAPLKPRCQSSADPGHTRWGKAVSVWTVPSLVVFVYILSFPYRDVIGIMIRELKHSCPKQTCLYT